jgi:hypothetical protein
MLSVDGILLTIYYILIRGKVATFSIEKNILPLNASLFNDVLIVSLKSFVKIASPLNPLFGS